MFSNHTTIMSRTRSRFLIARTAIIYGRGYCIARTIRGADRVGGPQLTVSVGQWATEQRCKYPARRSRQLRHLDRPANCWAARASLKASALPDQTYTGPSPASRTRLQVFSQRHRRVIRPLAGQSGMLSACVVYRPIRRTGHC